MSISQRLLQFQGMVHFQEGPDCSAGYCSVLTKKKIKNISVVVYFFSNCLTHFSLNIPLSSIHPISISDDNDSNTVALWEGPTPWIPWVEVNPYFQTQFKLLFLLEDLGSSQRKTFLSSLA